MKQMGFGFIFLILINFFTIAEPTDEFPCESIVASDGVRIRATPSLGGAILGRADTGASYTVMGKSDTSMALSDSDYRYWWYKVDLGDKKTGWIFGGFLLLHSDKQSGQSDLQFELNQGGAANGFLIREYYPNPDQKGMEESPELLHYVVFRDSLGKQFFLYIPDAKISSSLFISNEYRWYTLISSDQGWQELTSVQVDQKTGLVRLKVVTHQRGQAVPSIKTLVCSFNAAKKYFQLDKVE